MKIKLQQSVAGVNYNFTRGDEVETATDIAIDLIAAGFASPVGDVEKETTEAINALVEKRRPKVVSDGEMGAAKPKRERR